MSYFVDENGYFGKFGGAFIPEMLHANVEELRNSYLNIMDSEQFRNEYHFLLKHYAGRPSPLYPANRMSEIYNTRIFLKREDLNHTGSHKLNNTIGQILIAKALGKNRIIAETGAGQHGVAQIGRPPDCRSYISAVFFGKEAPQSKRCKFPLI
jgi:tryptophan synthase beta chain